MKLFELNERSQAMCPNDGLVSTTFKYKNVPFEDGIGLVKNILVGVCDICSEVVSIPPQSTPAIKTARERSVESVEVMLPANYLDTLDLACYRIEPSFSTDFRKRLLIYYIHRYSEGKLTADELQLIGNGNLMKLGQSADMPKRRLSIKISSYAAAQIDEIMNITHLSKTDLFKSLIVKIWKEIVEPAKPHHLDELVSLAAVIRA